ncbi:MAG: ABC transporter substrate-binding protein, partial [Pseudomonadota bacterium]
MVFGSLRRLAVVGLGAALASAPALYGSAQTPLAEQSHAYGAYSEPIYGADFTSFASANADAPKDCTLNLSARGSFDTLNPWIVNGRFAGGVFELLYDGLLISSPDEVSVGYGLIAESVDVSDSGDRATFSLHADAQFHDGHPILAEDVVFTAGIFRETARPFWRLLLKDAEVTATGER